MEESIVNKPMRIVTFFIVDLHLDTDVCGTNDRWTSG